MLPYPQEPMLARSVQHLPEHDELTGGSVYEPKFDGYRGIVFVQDGWCRIQSRHGRDVTASFPDIAAAAVEHLPSGVVLDGELVVWGDETSDFTELQRRLHGDTHPHGASVHPASFIAFDVLAGAGMDMRRSPFRVRRQALTILLGDVPAPLHVVPQTRDISEARAWMVNYAEAHVGIEGVVAKGLATRYEPGERGWQKLRIRDSVECVVGAVTGSLRAPARLVLGLIGPDGALQVVGCTAEITLPQSRRLGSHLVLPDDDHPWTSGTPLTGVPGWPPGLTMSMHLVQPTTVVEVSADALTSGPWTEPREFIRTRPEMQPHDIDSASFGH